MGIFNINASEDYQNIRSMFELKSNAWRTTKTIFLDPWNFETGIGFMVLDLSLDSGDGHMWPVP
jgi:hypothetical protein